MVINSNGLTLDEWRRGGLLNYRGSRVVGRGGLRLMKSTSRSSNGSDSRKSSAEIQSLRATLDGNRLAEVEELLIRFRGCWRKSYGWLP